MRIYRAGTGTLLALCLTGASLGGCASGRLVENVSGLDENGEHNVVLLSHEVTLDTFDRMAGVDGTHLRLRCDDDGALFDAPVCFGIDVPYVGLQDRGGTLWHAFASDGAGLYRMAHGRYRLEGASFSVLIDSRPETRCHEDSKGRTHCSTITRDEQERVAEALPTPIAFEVSPGDGCYLGHLTLRVSGGRVVEQTLERTLDAATFERLPRALRARARERVTTVCSPAPASPAG